MNERRKIFLIDDEVDLCLLMKTYFLRKNYEVYIAHTVTDALPHIMECQPNIILLTTAACQNVEEDIKKLKQAVPHAEIILDNFQLQSRF